MAAWIHLVFIFIHFAMRWPTEAQQRIGCFSFNHYNTVLYEKIQDPVGSIAACIHQCQTSNATYAGVRHGFNCYCGDSHNHTVNGEQLDDSSCTRSCNDHTLDCGDQFSIVIYSICNPGRYRDNTNDAPNCDASCNCKHHHICLYRNGSCPSYCESGWSGEACNVKVNQHTTIQSADEHLASSTGVSDMVTMSTGYGVSEHMTVNPNLSVTPCDGCPDLLTPLCVTSIGLVISIIVIIYLVYRLRVARIPDKQLPANIRATHNSSNRSSNDTQYENMGRVQSEPSNYENLGSRQTDPATYEELGMTGPTRG